MLDTEIHIPSTFSEVELVFKGSSNSPFLAPRGIWLVDNKLIVTDTGQNRVFIWNEVPVEEFCEPDVVLGQEDIKGTGRNKNGVISGQSLHYPSGIWSDGKILIVADAWNHRVLIWNEFPTCNGQPADVVVGQPDFNSNEPNAVGLGEDPEDNTLYWPYGVHSDGESLWIADTGNRRVLYFEKIPDRNFEHATAVIGKNGFEERDLDDKQPIWPYSVRIDRKGRMLITDTQYFRVLGWNDWKTSLAGSYADVVIGQPDLESKGQNQYNLGPIERSLNWCYDSFFYDNGLFVLDTGNSRIKWYNDLPRENNANPDGLLGQFLYTDGSENIHNAASTEKMLYWPFSICVDKDIIGLADTGNHRIVLSKLKI